MIEPLNSVAVVGMACRFPGARNIDQFWFNLKHSVESIVRISDEDLLSANISAATFQTRDYVRAAAPLDDVELFDPQFFGMTLREAVLTDPQQRLFLECGWEALEHAGSVQEACETRTGVYAGTGLSRYLLRNLRSHPDLLNDASLQLLLGNDKDFITTRLSYKLNLKGPSIGVQTACSTSLVAVHLACHGLLHYECDLALAGGVTVRVPQRVGYVYQEGGIVSPDGHCRSFDSKAKGTIFGSGVGVVVLKRLEDALKQGDTIYGVVKGSAVNNDGGDKLGYAAPSIVGQAEVIAEAQEVAGIEPDTIEYIEGHGTGTPLGDPVEVAALTLAFRRRTKKKQFCALGSVKTNIGHLDAAAGIAGFIKTVLALHHEVLPATLHFESPNSQIDLANGPFYINRTSKNWSRGSKTRRAGVSSFGIGGTNVHVVLEEGPVNEESPGLPVHILVMSAKTAPALEDLTANLCDYLKEHQDLKIADVAYTLQTGRRTFSHRRAILCRDVADMVTMREGSSSDRIVSAVEERRDRPVVFIFPGQGVQNLSMAQKLYNDQVIFREHIDVCADLLQPELGLDIRKLLRSERRRDNEIDLLDRTSIAQPVLFCVEYALAQLWISWGVCPHALIGHSLGEFVAACLAGVFSLSDALGLLVDRGRLMEAVPLGAMSAVELPESEVRPYLNDSLSIAAVNGPSLCVVSGRVEEIAAIEQKLGSRLSRRLHSDRAFHSSMMDPVLLPFTARVKQVALKAPTIPWLSTLKGTWITVEEASNPAYWSRQLRDAVLFAKALDRIAEGIPDAVLLEVGPGRTMTTLANNHPFFFQAVSSSGHDTQGLTLDSVMLALGHLWISGGKIDWHSVHLNQRRHRIALPTYPFQRRRCWIDPNSINDINRSNYGVDGCNSRATPIAPAPSCIQTEEGVPNELPGDPIESILTRVMSRQVDILLDQIRVLHRSEDEAPPLGA